MIYDFIKDNEKIFPIDKGCQVLVVSSSVFYRWKKKIISNTIHIVNHIKEKITSIYFESKQRYGSPRISIELQSLGYSILRITVAKYMKQMGLRNKLSKKFKVTTDSKYPPEQLHIV